MALTWDWMCEPEPGAYFEVYWDSPMATEQADGSIVVMYPNATHIVEQIRYQNLGTRVHGIIVGLPNDRKTYSVPAGTTFRTQSIPTNQRPTMGTPFNCF